VFAAFFYAGESGEIAVRPDENSLVAPRGTVGIDGAVVAEALREVFPGDSGAVDEEDGVEDVAQVDFRRLPGRPAVER
jgi:hypothetical protein